MQTAETFRAVADPTRRAILDRLSQRPRTVGELVGGFEVSQPAISQHLRVLRDAGLVTADRAGRHRVYRLRPEGLREVYEWIRHYERFWEHRLDALAQLLDEEADR